jgi:peptidoglycan/xylan/chitin deacetylase (PgdA/CDA1 family)
MKGAVLIGAGAAGFAFWHAQVPTSQLYGKTICRRREAGRLIALTYDDGPNPKYTESLLRVLEKHDARATFFLIGRWAQREPGLMREVQAAGHALGNHTWSHPTLALCSAVRVRDELRRCREAVEAGGGQFAQVDGGALMRPPWGRRRPGTLRTLREEGYTPVLWSVTGWDWRPRETAASIAARCGKAREGDLILLHDGVHTEPAGDRSASVGATEEILRRFSDEGYRFVTVPELMSASNGARSARPRDGLQVLG